MGTIFFSNHNLRCQYCQNYEISQQGEGIVVSAEFGDDASPAGGALPQHQHSTRSRHPQIIGAVYLAAQH